MPDGGFGGPTQERVVYESDWLASDPFFYNLRTGSRGDRIDDVIDLADLEFDPEGLNDYLDFGFSVFGRTPVRDVRVLRHSSRLLEGPGGLRVEHLDDPARAWFERRSSVDEVLDLVSARINDAAASAEDIVVPTSGGLDSRLIDLLLADRSRLRAFTYGVSDDPARSFEAVKARELARRLRFRWDLVPLGGFHEYFEDWDALYGVATHAHGMYHLEFYHRILEHVREGSLVLSGACGEWFAGDDPEVRTIPVLRSPDDVLEVFRYGRMCADSGQSNFRSERLGAWRMLEEAPELRTEMLPRVVAVVRLRMILLSYLLRVPASLGLRPRAPFLDSEVALRMLTLPPELRHERRWEHEIFAAHGVDLEATRVPADSRNTLNFRAMRVVPLRPLDADLLREVVRPEYVRRINRTVGRLGLPWEAYWRLGWTPGFRRAVEATRQMGVTERRSLAYGAYLTLKPLESLLRRRDHARGVTS
jgi:hypothetical protein